MTINELRNTIEQRKGKRQQIKETLTTLQQRISDKNVDLRRHEEAREVIREVALKTQAELSFHISDITSLALDAVYDNPYELVADFIQKRNKTECDLYFKRGDVRIDPLTASGGGAIDIASFALRIASWAMLKPRVRNTIILDEPFSHVKGNDANKRTLEMVHTLSKKLNLQFIMVADERINRNDLLERVDRAFEVEISKNTSLVEQVV
jgi:DNA repair exonuclease SbcCD ATPase subunit